MAALEPGSKGGETVAVYINHSGGDFLLCTLKHGTIYNQQLDLGFVSGETITLFTSGKGRVHLTGYRVFDDEDEDGMMGDLGEMDSDMSEDISDDEAAHGEPGPPTKKLALKAPGLDEVDDDEDDSSDEDYDEEDEDGLNGFLDDEAEEASSDEEEDDDDDEEEDDDDSEAGEEESEEDEPSDSEILAVAEQIKRKMADEEAKKAKKQKLEKPNANTPQGAGKQQPKTSQQQKSPQGQTPKQSKTPQQQKNHQDKQQQTPKNQKAQQQTPKGQQQKADKKEGVKTPQQPSSNAGTPKRKLPSGIVMEDLKAGHGPEAKTNKMVHVYYTGKLSNGKVFDSNTSGKPFKFRLGKNEVIKGWELGLQGMKVGGKRRLTIPPALAYGDKAMGGIPRNSTLHFDVELKTVS